MHWLLLYLLIGVFLLWLGLRKHNKRLSYFEFILALLIFPMVWPIFLTIGIFSEVKKRRNNKELLKHLSRKYNGKDS